MTDVTDGNDKPPRSFSERLAALYAFYGKDFSKAILSVWWGALRSYDERAVADALTRHVSDPDHGQFLPRPADVVRLMAGSTLDSAMSAWSKVERAIRSVGSYETVVFDEAIINATINDMGGWIKLCATLEEELPFRAKEFETRYRGYRTVGLNHLHTYPRSLPGLIESHNSARGLGFGHHPILVGDKDACKAVYCGGSTVPALTFNPMPGENDG